MPRALEDCRVPRVVGPGPAIPEMHVVRAIGLRNETDILNESTDRLARSFVPRFASLLRPY